MCVIGNLQTCTRVASVAKRAQERRRGKGKDEELDEEANWSSPKGQNEVT